VVGHCVKFLHIPVSPAVWVLSFFPGVPIFFFISGFLISAAWERNPHIGMFARNRALRIFPGYWATFLFSFVAIVLVQRPHWLDLLLWSAARVSLLNDWNPQWLRSYGTGVANAALWTIPVEVSFYVATPMLYWLFRKTRHSDWVLAAVIVASFAVAVVDFEYMPAGRGANLLKFISLTPLPWIGMFAVGMLAQHHRSVIMGLVRGRFWLWLLLYGAVSLAAAYHPWKPVLVADGTYLGVINFLCLCGLLLASAYCAPTLARRLLRRNDFSYGLYLFHMPVMNIALVMGLAGYPAAAATIAGAAVMAVFCWFFVERPCLRARVHPVYRHE
jgi:peptidoglycan/LPS O-acetylase OafA/YrhL